MKPAKSSTHIKGLEALKARDSRWYLPDFEQERAVRMTSTAAAIRKNDRNRQENYRRYAALYSNLPLLGLTPRRFSQRQQDSGRERLSLNVIRSCSDSFVAKLTNERPMVSCITTGADWDLQQKSATLETFLTGQFYETDLYEIAPLVALDMAVTGTGSVQIYSDDVGTGEERIVIERIVPGESYCDDEEAYSGPKSLRTRYRSKYVDRLQAMAIWPEAAEELATVTRATGDYDDGSVADNAYTDTICIDEAWHLPSCEGAGDGRHTIACGRVLILDEPWTKPYFPIVDMYRQKPQFGVWGTGLAEELQGIQFEINVILNMIRKAIRMSGSIRWMIENGSNVNTQFISDIVGSMIRYSGTMPQAVTPPAIAPEVYQQLDRLYGKAFEITGISQLSAQSQKPAGLNSGKALQTYTDLESERFSVAFREYQHFFLKVARQVIALAREIGQRNPKFKVKAVDSGRMMNVVTWADVHMEEEEYILQLVPTNAFARDPSAKLQQIQDFVNAGIMDPKTGRRLMDGIPDLKAEDETEFASYNLTRQMVSDILKSGEFQPPEPFMDLDEAVKVATAEYCRVRRMKGIEEGRLEMLRNWITQANDMKPPPPPGPPGMPPGPPGMPPGPPGMPPGPMPPGMPMAA